MDDKLLDSLRHLGYLKEEEYFFKKNKELLHKRRTELDRKRTQQEAEGKKQACWMICPKCGHSLETTLMSAIRIEQCTHCRGIYMDADELSLLLEVRTEQGRVRKFFSRFRK